MPFKETDLHLESVNDRLERILLVLRYDSYRGKKYFTFYDRLVISKHRSGLLSFLCYLCGEIPHSKFIFYELPDEIDNKITAVHNEILNTDWNYKNEYMY